MILPVPSVGSLIASFAFRSIPLINTGCYANGARSAKEQIQTTVKTGIKVRKVLRYLNKKTLEDTNIRKRNKTLRD